MRKLYKDDPTIVERYIETLGPTEERAFNIGYLAAVMGIVEQFVDSKREFLELMMSVDDTSKKLLLSRIALLDLYEDHYDQRAKQLSKYLALH